MDEPERLAVPVPTVDSVWAAVLEQAWLAFLDGTLPIGAAVVDESGAVVSMGRNRRRGPATTDGVLSGSRIAHAELIALSQLPITGNYQDFMLYSNVEPCAMCVGATLQTGIANAHYAWSDAYAGAANASVKNPQRDRWPLVFHLGPCEVSTVTAVLIACHYELVRQQRPPHTAYWVAADPEFFTRLHRGGAVDLVARTAEARGDSSVLMPRLFAALSEVAQD